MCDGHLLRLVGQDDPQAAAGDETEMRRIHERATYAECVAFGHAMATLFSRFSQEPPGWVERLVERLSTQQDTAANPLVLETLVAVNATVIEDNMRRNFAPSLRLV